VEQHNQAKKTQMNEPRAVERVCEAKNESGGGTTTENDERNETNERNETACLPVTFPRAFTSDCNNTKQTLILSHNEF